MSIVFPQGQWLTPNFYTVPLGSCDVGWHVDRGIVALACVGSRQDPGVAAAGGKPMVVG